MLKRYLVNDVTALDRIRLWVADPDHRAQLIESRVADTVEYHMVVNSRDPLVNLCDLVTAEFQDSISECEFPRRY